jgi:alpha-tubulin suppressor-like RCC1 family protein
MDETFSNNHEVFQEESIDIKLQPLIIAWGRSDNGNLFTSDTNEIGCSHPLSFQGTRRLIQISSNVYHSAAVTSTGELYTCGSNEEGQVNPYKDENGQVQAYIPKPRIFEFFGHHRICSVSCGLFHTVCVNSSGLALSFGGILYIQSEQAK